MPKITKKLLKRSSQIDYDREIAIIAVLEEKGKKRIIAEVRLLATHDNSEAEFAIVIADKCQGMGLGNKLTSYMIEIAIQRNIKTISASVLKANNAMVHIFRKMGFTFEAIDFSTYSVKLELGEKTLKEIKTN